MPHRSPQPAHATKPSSLTRRVWRSGQGTGEGSDVTRRPEPSAGDGQGFIAPRPPPRLRLYRSLCLICGALAVNLGLFLAMEQLASRLGSEPVMRVRSMVDFVRLKRETPPEVKERVEPPEAEPPEELPRPDVPAPSAQRVVVNQLSAQIPHMNIPLNITGGPYIGPMGMGSGIGEFREPVPLVRITPMYPPLARSRRLEGVVKVEFTVGEDGSVNGPVVVYSQPPGIFDRAVLSAIRHWKFESKVVDGKAVPWRTLQTVSFRMVN